MRRLFSTAAVLALAAAVLAGCAGGASEAGSGPVVRVGVGIDSAFAPVFAADKGGLFAKAGLNVQVVQFAQGGEAVDAANAGQIQMAIAGDSSTLAKTAAGLIRMLSVYQQTDRYIKLVAAPAVRTPKDIKKIGVVKGSVAEYSTLKMLAANGMTENEVTFVYADPPSLPALLQKGDIDSFIFPEPWPGRAVAQGAHVLAANGEFGYTSLLVSSANIKWLDGNAATARKVLDVIGQAAAQVTADPALGAQVVTQTTKIPVEQAKAALGEMTFAVRPFTAADLGSLADIGTFLVDRKVLSRPVELDEVVDKDFLR